MSESIFDKAVTHNICEFVINLDSLEGFCRTFVVAISTSYGSLGTEIQSEVPYWVFVIC